MFLNRVCDKELERILLPLYLWTTKILPLKLIKLFEIYYKYSIQLCFIKECHAHV